MKKLIARWLGLPYYDSELNKLWPKIAEIEKRLKALEQTKDGVEDRLRDWGPIIGAILDHLDVYPERKLQDDPARMRFTPPVVEVITLRKRNPKS